jgi:Protein of unknown function (DUF1360)
VWSELVAIIGIVAASYRVTRLVTCDSFPSVWRLRCRIVRSGPSWLADLVTCPWCAGVWVSGCITLVTVALASVPVPVWTWLLAASVAGWLGQHDDCEECE